MTTTGAPGRHTTHEQLPDDPRNEDRDHGQEAQVTKAGPWRREKIARAWPNRGSYCCCRSMEYERGPDFLGGRSFTQHCTIWHIRKAPQHLGIPANPGKRRCTCRPIGCDVGTRFSPDRELLRRIETLASRLLEEHLSLSGRYPDRMQPYYFTAPCQPSEASEPSEEADCKSTHALGGSSTQAT